MVLGLHISKNPNSRCWRNERKRKRHPFCTYGVFPRIVCALPDKLISKKSILDTDQKLHIDTGQIDDSAVLQEVTAESNEDGEVVSYPMFL